MKESKHIIAYCVFNPNTLHEKSKDEILREINQSFIERLPDYMHPSHCIVIDQIPMTSNGKVDKQKLEEMFAINPLISGTHKCIDSVHFTVLKVWENVFQMGSIGTNAEFDKLGGNSIIAAHLVNEINKIYHTKFAPAWLLECRTITEQADAIRSLNYSGYKSIITFNNKGESLPLYLIHPALIGAECYAELARQLDRKINLFGVESYNLFHDPVKNNVQELAAYYAPLIVKHIEEHALAKQIYLGGWSLGAAIAFEVHHLLQKQGISIVNLILIEPPQPANSEDSVQNDIQFEAQSMGNTPDYIVAYLHHLPNEVAGKVQTNFVNDIVMSSQYNASSLTTTSAIIFEANQWNATSLVGKKVSLAVWSEYIKDLKIIKLDGDHLSIMEKECLSSIAKQINELVLQPTYSHQQTSSSSQNNVVVRRGSNDMPEGVAVQLTLGILHSKNTAVSGNANVVETTQSNNIANSSVAMSHNS
jgi:thioesterase domain-containing protein